MQTRTIISGLLLTLISHLVLRAQGTPTANVGWYNGDCQSGIPGQSNWYFSDQEFGRTYDDFVVPIGGWTVSGLFSHNNMTFSGLSAAVWEIRSGISAGNGGTVVASGLSPATQTLVLSYPDGEKIYRVEVDGLRVQLAPGTYWMNVSPIAAFTQSYVCASVGVGAAGNPPGNDGKGFSYALGAPSHVIFQPVQSSGQTGTSGDYSQGVLISTASAPPAPSIAAVVNAASWQAGPVSPGEIITIGGTGLGPSTPSDLMLNDSGKVSTTLDGVQVLFNGIAAPQTYVSGVQINAVVPYEVAGATNLSVQVSAGGQTSQAFPLKLAGTAPAIFTANGSGTGPAAILNQDNSYNGPGNPAAKGSYVVLFLTGEGLTNPGGVTGKVTSISAVPPLTPQPVLSPVTVSIGGQPVFVAFYGEAPDMVSGVMQINVQIPANAPSGNLPVSVSVGGSGTQSGVTVSVE